MVKVNIDKEGKHGEVRKIFNIASRNRFSYTAIRISLSCSLYPSIICFTYSKSDITIYLKVKSPHFTSVARKSHLTDKSEASLCQARK